MKTKGFTLIELLVVIVIIGILVAIALPNFIKIKDKAKEAEVKQNLHAIQLAVERYATDSDGNYPFYLIGGEARINMVTVNALNAPISRGDGTWTQGTNMEMPFDMFWVATTGHRYELYDWGDLMDPQGSIAFGDTLAYEGYLPKYPKNPFVIGDSRILFAADPGWGAGNRCYFWGWGGEDGTHMWNVAFTGDMPQMSALVVTSEKESVISEVPGQFSYHPRWSDGVTHFGHQSYQARYHSAFVTPSFYSSATPQPGQTDEDQVFSLDVAAYDLAAFGSARTKGMDIDHSLTMNYGGVDNHAWRTGYFTLGQERNPYIGPDGGEGDYAQYGSAVDNFDERPVSDAFEDFVIIHLSSGLDIKRDDNGNNF